MAVKILPYDNEAPKIFEEIKRFIYSIIPYRIEVEHIGLSLIHI